MNLIAILYQSIRMGYISWRVSVSRDLWGFSGNMLREEPIGKH